MEHLHFPNENATGPVTLSQLFDGKDTLAVYSFMFGPERERPCPGCTHFLAGLDGSARHIRQRLALVVVAKSPIQRLLDWASARGWEHLNLLSTAGNSYGRDYFGDSSALAAAAGLHRRQGMEPGQEYRHNDLLAPMWNMFDVTPEGRGDFHPKLGYR
jgi:predicted dithiol-disulfide oxidoreductase (DUF899 family)